MGKEDIPTSSVEKVEAIAPEAEAAQILAQLTEKRKSLDEARFEEPNVEEGTGLGLGDISNPRSERGKRDEKYNVATDLTREARNIANPEVQRFAIQYASLSPEEIKSKIAEIDASGNKILREEVEPGEERAPETQKRLDDLHNEKMGLRMAGKGGLLKALESLKKKMEQSGIEN